jgi:predicted NBD/HSP70 family sugar kinase
MEHNVNIDLYLHIRVLIGIILGLSVTRLISGIAGLIQHPGRDPIWPVCGWPGCCSTS